MPRNGFGQLPQRDSLELASLASSDSPTQSTPSSPSGAPSSRRLSLEDPLSEDQTSRPGHPRTLSVSSAFDFAHQLFPISTTAAGYTALGTSSNHAPIGQSLGSSLEGGGGASLERHKTLTYLNGLSLIVGLIIGSGIFSSPSQVNVNAGSPGAALIIWVIAGLLAWTGAASFAELGGAIPLNGGAQAYLSKIFGDWCGFLFTWCAVFVLKPGSAAIIAIILGEYTVSVFAGPGEEENGPSWIVWVNKGVAIGGLLLVTAMNCLSTRLATRMGDAFMLMKFVALIGVTIVGIVVAASSSGWEKGDTAHQWKEQNWFEGTSTDPSKWAVALYAGLWAFDGWDNTNYVVGEFVNPAKDLPRVIHTAMPLVIVAYLFANISYIFVLPPAVINSTDTIAVKFGQVVFGGIGSAVLALTVAMSCFGALNATAFTSGRLVYAAGKEGFLPSAMGKIGIPGRRTASGGALRMREKARQSCWERLVAFAGDDDGTFGFTPINAMAFNTFLTICYVVVGEFGTLVTFYGVAGYTFYFLTVLGLIVLRVREPHLERPYRTWITTPVIFCCVSLFLLSRAAFAEPVQTLIVVIFVACGVPVYLWRVRGHRSRAKGTGGFNWKFWKRLQK